ncbi:hypothetical protein J8281_11675 [Aquimarina sp. U1-2]|uniref:leucine-rich repeat domain-containing protein n=1 Tax=Aquimarina sp. U1-2 TaxID=2823141 RepID=UPI001AECBEEE|nr:hypothetical protein [Aquimarina sp. U1-2]MBP2832846.1 hypothetical protein [Aquimarina sp. U1-2]
MEYLKPKENGLFSLARTLLIIVAFFTSVVSIAQISQNERQALIDFYTATNGTNWKNTQEGNQPWQIDDPNSLVTDWYGVEVRDGRVTKLALNKNNLTGSLPSSIGVLDRMIQLVLSSNKIGGDLPNSLVQLTELRSLHISKNEFTGPLPIQKIVNATKISHLYFDGNNFSGPIPPEIVQLSNLSFANFSYNQLSGSIPLEITQLPKLASLYLSGNELSGTIPSAFGQMTKLSRLSLGENNLTGTIPAELGNLTTLGSLSLSGNELTGTIPPELGQLTNLFALSFNGNQLTGNIPPEFGQLINIVRLYFHGNQLTGTIPSELGQLVKLENLQLGDNQFTGSIPSSFGNLSNLKSLSIRNNRLSGNIPSELGQITTLEHLHLHNNDFSGPIPSSLTQLVNLKALYLYSNNLSGIIPQGFSSMPNLKNFGISGNKFVFSDFEADFTALNTNISSFTYNQQQKTDAEKNLNVSIGGSITLTSDAFNSPNNSYQWYKNNSAISGATNKDFVISDITEAEAGSYKILVTNSIIDRLRIYRNNIHLTVSEAVDGCVVSDSEKQALIDLYNATGGANWANNTNWLTDAPVCDWFGVNVDDLGVVNLNLARNNLVGQLPSSIQNLSNLKFLYLNNNAINGQLPESIGLLSKLKVLYLSKNNVEGNFPNQLFNLNNLSELRLDINQFTGNIPDSGWNNLVNLQRLNLYQNNFVGAIPREFGLLTKMRDLNVASNQLNGTIPNELSLLTNLEYLALSNNEMLSGEIPDAFGELINLENFYISETSVKGGIPTSLGNLSKLEVIWLHQTGLKGKIPQQWSLLPNLKDFRIQDSNFVFSDFESEFSLYLSKLGSNFSYQTQLKVDEANNLSVEQGNSITLTSTTLTSANNAYQWYKDGVAIVDATNKEYVIENASDADAGVYNFTATNSVVTGLTLERNPITLSVTSAGNELNITINTKELPTTNFDLVSGDISVSDLVSGSPDSETSINLGVDDGGDRIVQVNVKPSEGASPLYLRFTANSNGISNVQVQNDNNWLDFSPEFYQIDENTIYFFNKKKVQTIPFTLNLINGVQYDFDSGPLMLTVKDGIDLTGATLQISIPSYEGPPNLEIVQPSTRINGFEVERDFWDAGSYKFVLTIQEKTFKGNFIVAGFQGEE